MSLSYRNVRPTLISSPCRETLVLKVIRCCQNAGCEYIMALIYNYIYVITLFEIFDYIEQFYYGFIIKNIDTVFANFKIVIHC
jgi:hypothetical protein